MKFQFKEGQWFDARKLTDWQKQWCLENLVFTKYAHKLIENGDVYRYRYKGESFISTSPDYINSSDEITFNDFYWEGEEASHESAQESIFDNPSWVTCCNDSLGQVTLGKDYKVVNVNNDNYTIIMDKGIEGSLHKDRFHKVTPQDLLPKEVEEPELIRSDYKLKEGDYLELSKLSDWQKDYLQNNFPCYNEETFDWGSNVYWESYEDSVSEFVGSWVNKREEISFNDLFQEVE